MINRFDTHNDFFKLGVVLFNVLDEFILRVCRTSHKNGPCLGKCRDHMMKVILIFGRMTAVVRVGMMVKMQLFIFWVHELCIRRGFVEVNNSRGVVIDPNDSMEMFGHWVSLRI